MNQNSKRITQTVTDFLAHLAKLEARDQNAGRRTSSSAEVRTRLGLTGKK